MWGLLLYRPFPESRYFVSMNDPCVLCKWMLLIVEGRVLTGETMSSELRRGDGDIALALRDIC